MNPGTTATDRDEHSGPPRGLTICVDDFGMSAGIDGSVFALAEQGRISATSCLVDGPAWLADAPRLRSTLLGRIDIGLHLNLSETFDAAHPQPSWSELVRRAYMHRLDMQRLQTDIERQMDRFVAAVHTAPDFIDGHRHVHQLPGVRVALLSALARRGWRPWLRCTLPARGVRRPIRERLKAQIIGCLGGHAWQRLAGRQGYALNRHLLGVYDFSGSTEEHKARLRAWLSAARDGDLLMCHTALPGMPFQADPIGTARECEHAVLASPGFGELLMQHAIRVRRLARPPGG
jgi:predicted glycoside hydrolase/deacetylase ChbG (UPF0249 family)